MKQPEITPDKRITIGVGVTTYKRPHTFRLWIRQFRKHAQNLPEEIEIAYHVQTFFPQKHSGVAAVKNACLRELIAEGCDYIFLFDDDCFPIHDEWWMPFIEAHLRTGQHHFLWLMDDSDKYGLMLGRKKLKEENGITLFRNSQGCCQFFTRHAVQACGAFDEKFKLYGSEHENYSLRLYKLGLNTIGPYLSVPGIEEYIYSLDVMGTEPYAAQLGNEIGKYGKLKSAGNTVALRESAAKNEMLLKEATRLRIPWEMSE
jgi:hypothetical protein